MARKSADKSKAKAPAADAAESTPAPEPVAPPAPEPEAEPTPTEETAGETSAEAPAAGQQDSITFSRCAGCANAKEVDRSAGTLVCSHYNMLVNAEVDEIPDDCIAYTPTDGAPAVEPAASDAPAPEAPADNPPADDVQAADAAAPETPQ